MKVEELSELAHRRAGRHAQDSAPEVLDLGLGTVVLVRELADQLLERVLDRHQAGDTAVLVHDQRDVRGRGLHLAQQVVGRLGLRHEHRRADELADRLVAVGRVGLDRAHDVLEERDTDQVVGARAGDGDP